jgi:hypothetical protein
MPEPMMDYPDARGTRWLQQQVLAILASGPEVPGEPAPTCTWGTSFETRGTLYLCLAGEAAPKALRFAPSLITNCGAGHRPQQNQARAMIRRMLRKLGLLSI